MKLRHFITCRLALSAHITGPHSWPQSNTLWTVWERDFC